VTGERYLTSRLQQLRAEAKDLSEEFDAEEMWRFVRDAAAMFERFLQGAGLSQPPGQRSFTSPTHWSTASTSRTGSGSTRSGALPTRASTTLRRTRHMARSTGC
jgi:hypothetical protein